MIKKRVGILKKWFQRKFLSSREKKLVCLGLTGVIVAIIFGWGLFAAAIPWRGTADAPQHLDYAWQLYHGHLPSFWDGTQAPLGDYKFKIQFVSHHPPLYYALLAPVVGPLIDGGHWVMATAYARVFSILIGILCALALAWGGWLVGGKRRALFAVAVPAIGTSLLAFNVAGDIMNDSLSMLFAILAMVLSILIIQKGLNRNYLAWLTVVCLGGMATRSSFIGTLAVVLVSIVISAQLHAKGSRLKRLFSAAAICAIIVAVLALGTGWFYARNYQLSGSIFRNRPAGSAQQIFHKQYRTLPQVLKDHSIYEMLTTRLYGRPWKILPKVAGETINVRLAGLVSVTVAAGFMTFAWRERKSVKLVGWAVIGILALQFALTYGQQIAYAVGYGGLNRRYLLPAWLPFSLYLAAATLYIQKLRGAAVIVVTILGWASVYASIVNYSVFVSNGSYNSGPWGMLIKAVVDRNNLPFVLVPILIIGLGVGILLESIALWKLTQKPNT